MRVGWAALGVMSLMMVAGAQSVKGNEPSHLVSGVNRGTLDSTVGAQYWDFQVNAGRFQLVFAPGSPQEAFTVARQPQVALAFVPQAPGATFTQRVIPGGGTVFVGSVTQRTRVTLSLTPAKSPLVRQMTDYTLVATGSVDFGG